MGLFSRRTQTYVSSTAYPLGENDPERVTHLRQTIINAVLQNRSMTESLTQGYLRGQGVQLRNAFNYIQKDPLEGGYFNGPAASNSIYIARPDHEVIKAALYSSGQVTLPTEIAINRCFVGGADSEWWADRYLAQEYGYDLASGYFAIHPPGIDDGADVLHDYQGDGYFVTSFTNPDTYTVSISYTVSDFPQAKIALHCTYRTITTSDNTAVTFRPAELDEVDSFTSNTVVVNIDGAITEETTETTITVLEGEARVSERLLTITTSAIKFFLYEMGLGTYPEIDAWLDIVELGTEYSPYYPAVPIRVDGAYVNDSDLESNPDYNEDLYKTSKKLLKKLGLNYDEVTDLLTEGAEPGTNPDEDIDYAFVVFGVDIKTEMPEAKRYLYYFFDMLINYTNFTKLDFDAWEVLADFNMATAGSPPINRIEIYSAVDRDKNYDVKLQWQYILKTTSPGEIGGDAKKGDCRITMNPATRVRELGVDMALDYNELTIEYQIEADSFVTLVVGGLVYENFIYNGYSVVITAHDAFFDLDEEGKPNQNGFIIPLNYQIVKEMGMVLLTEVSYMCQHMVVSSYEVVKEKWYQTLLFQVILVIIAVVIIVVTWGAAGPAVAGGIASMLAAGGTVLLWMKILAALIQVLGMMVLMSLVTEVATALFGPTWGPLIATIASMFIGNVAAGSSSATSGAFTVTAVDVVNISSAILNAHTQSQLAKLPELMENFATFASEYRGQMDEIAEMMKDLFGNGRDIIDIQGMVDATNQSQTESFENFIRRTLMTGSDVADVTRGMIENFTDVGLQLPNAT